MKISRNTFRIWFVLNLVCCPEIKGTTSRIENSTFTKFKKALCEDETPEFMFEQNIVGGEEAGVGEFPFQATIGYQNISKDSFAADNPIKYKCGGSLIADDIVITSARCVTGAVMIPKVVKLGRTSLIDDEEDYSEGDDVEIQSFKKHPNYSKVTKQNDIALIKLKRPFNDTKWFIKPICLSSNDEDLPFNFTITGYGMNNVNSKKPSNWLLKAIVNRYPRKKCIQMMNDLNRGERSKKVEITDTQFCAIGYEGANSCQTDSGGPLSFEKFMRGGKLTFLYGIVSYGIRCSFTSPGIYTKVNEYLDWIEQEMNLME